MLDWYNMALLQLDRLSDPDVLEDDGIPYSCWTDDPVDELEDEIE